MQVKLINRNRPEIRYNPNLVRFPGDQIDYEDNRYRIVCEGYLLNSRSLSEANPGLALKDIILRSYEQGGFRAALNLLRGSFVLAIHDQAAGVTCIGNDMLSKKPLYYRLDGTSLMADTSFQALVRASAASGLPMTIHQAAVNQLLERCSFLESDTYVSEIRFLEPFVYLRADADGLSAVRFDYQQPEPCPEDTGALIGRIDTLFENACQMAVEKLRAEGYKPVFTLSAGMDSRCSLLKSLPACLSGGGEPPLCLTYGAAGCMELRIAEKLATGYGCPLQVNEIDPVSFIPDRDRILDRNEGMMYYAGTTGLTAMLDRLDTSAIGMVITGLGGGEIMGDLCQPEDSDQEQLYNQLLAPILPDEEARAERIRQIRERYASYNEYICLQDLRTCQNFAYTSHHAFETFSPFLHEDLFMLLLRTPQQEKRLRRLYARWYLSAIGDPTPTSAFQGPVRITSPTDPDRLIKGVVRRLRRMLGLRSKWDMNPIALWVRDYPGNRQYMDSTLEEDLSLMEEPLPQLTDALRGHYQNADADTRLRILTVTGMIRRILQASAGKDTQKE